jgi:hypothetical protein
VERLSSQKVAVRKHLSIRVATLPERSRPPLVLPTEAQRSGGTCGSAVLSWKCFLTERGVAEGPAVVSPCQPAPQVKPSLWVGKSWMTISRSPFSLDCAGALSLERSIGGFALAPVGLGKQAVGLDERGVSLNSGIEL